MPRSIVVAASYSGPYRSNGGRIAAYVGGMGRIDICFRSEPDAFRLVDLATTQAGLDPDETATLRSATLAALETAFAVLTIDA